MAWIQERRRADGGVSVRVEWRLGGGREGQRQEETFSAGSDAQNRARAEGFKQMVDAAGQHWPGGWVNPRGEVVLTESAGAGGVPPELDQPEWLGGRPLLERG